MRNRWNRILFAVVLSAAGTACTPMPTIYLKEHVGRVTQDEVEAQLGPPFDRGTLPDGQTRWEYVDHESYATYLTYSNPDAEVCYIYELLFDARKVLRHWSYRTKNCGTVN